MTATKTLVARDTNPLLPCSKGTPRPLLRPDFDQGWQRWKLREAEQEQQRLFGGDSGDDGSLCLAMLDVMIRLFGDIDYRDPECFSPSEFTGDIMSVAVDSLSISNFVIQRRKDIILPFVQFCFRIAVRHPPRSRWSQYLPLV
jgi:hypothetical protein